MLPQTQRAAQPTGPAALALYSPTTYRAPRRRGPGFRQFLAAHADRADQGGEIASLLLEDSRLRGKRLTLHSTWCFLMFKSGVDTAIATRGWDALESAWERQQIAGELTGWMAT